MGKILKVNNWRAEKYVARFYNKYCVEINAKVEAAREIMNNPKYPWENKDQKEKAAKRLAILDTQNIDYHSYYREVSVIVHQHEQLASTLSELYSAWLHKVSYKGQQPNEMMKMQAEELQKIFIKIYECIEPLGLDIKPPVGYKNEEQ